MSDQFADRSVLDELRDELGAQFAALPATRPVPRAPAWRRATVAVAAVVLVITGAMLGRELLRDSYPMALGGLTIEFNGDLNDGLSPGDIERLQRRPLSVFIADPGKEIEINGVAITCPSPAAVLDLIDRSDPCDSGRPVAPPANAGDG